jgi:A/G-specific adenine glycosylase
VKRRRAGWIVAIAGSAVLVEKRPAKGVWGGLWSVPEVAHDADPGEACATLGLTARTARALPLLTHAFTHFTLEATPWLVKVRRPARLPADRERQWLDLGEAPEAALPAPVKQLLATLPVAARRSVDVREGSGAGSRAARRRP